MDLRVSLILSSFAWIAQGNFETWRLCSLNDKSAPIVSTDRDKAICLIAGAAILGLAAYFCNQGSRISVPSSHDDQKPPVTAKRHPRCRPARINRPIPPSLPRVFEPMNLPMGWESLNFTGPFMHREVSEKLPKIVNSQFTQWGDLTAALPFHNDYFRSRSNLGFHPIFPVLFKWSRRGQLENLYSFSGNTEFHFPQGQQGAVCAGIKELGSAAKIEAFWNRKLAEVRVFYSNYRENTLQVDRVESYRMGENNNFSQFGQLPVTAIKPFQLVE